MNVHSLDRRTSPDMIMQSKLGAAEIFVQRLRALTRLGDDELQGLRALISEPRSVLPERPIVREGDTPEHLHILIDGWAARAKSMADGRRHLCGPLVPGDLCDVDGLHVRRYDYSVTALTRATVATISRRALLALCERYPAIARAFTWLGFVDNAMLAEAATSLARRSARQRVVHLLCEFRERLTAVDLTRPGGFALPVTQEKLADMLGLTSVHLNRTLQQLRGEGLIQFIGRDLTSSRWNALESEGEFSPNYLHLDGMR